MWAYSCLLFNWTMNCNCAFKLHSIKSAYSTLLYTHVWTVETPFASLALFLSHSFWLWPGYFYTYWCFCWVYFRWWPPAPDHYCLFWAILFQSLFISLLILKCTEMQMSPASPFTGPGLGVRAGGSPCCHRQLHQDLFNCISTFLESVLLSFIVISHCF